MKLPNCWRFPDYTISRKLQAALDRLRANLTKAGFAAAVPLLSAEGLSKAILTGHECPPGLTAKVMSRIANAGKEAVKAASHRAPLHAAAAKSASFAGTALLIGGAMVAALGVTGVFWYGKKAEPVAQAFQPVTAQPGKAVLPAPAEAKPVSEPGLPARWTFEAGIPKDFKLIQGEWRWEAPQGTTAGAIAFLTDYGKPPTLHASCNRAEASFHRHRKRAAYRTNKKRWGCRFSVWFSR